MGVVGPQRTRAGVRPQGGGWDGGVAPRAGSHAAKGGVHRIRAARGGRLGPSRRLQWLGARLRRARGAGGGDVAEDQAGGASDEGGAESAGAKPREVLETPAAERVQVSAGLRGRPRSGLGSGWPGVRSALRRAGSWIRGHPKQPRAPRPDSAPAWVPVPPAFLPRVRAVSSSALPAGAARPSRAGPGRASHLAGPSGQAPGKGRSDPRVVPHLRQRRPPGPGGCAASAEEDPWPPGSLSPPHAPGKDQLGAC